MSRSLIDMSAVAELGQLPRLPGVLVTGTDTDVGKTVIAGAICRSLTQAGLHVEPFKPAASGCSRAGGMLCSDDAAFLAAAADSRRPVDEIAPQRFRHALAPNVAASRAGRQVDVRAICDAYRRLDGACDAVVVEGVGGLMCPISDGVWVIHLAAMMRLPLVIVARPDLGTINHTLLTIHAARSAGLHVAGVVVNRYRIDPLADGKAGPGDLPDAPDADLAIYTNPDQIGQRGQVKVLALCPDEPTSSVERGTIGRGTQFAIDQVDWLKILRGE